MLALVATLALLLSCGWTAYLIAQARPGDLPEVVTAFLTRIGIEDTLPERGLRREDIPKLAREAYADPSHVLNPIPVTEADLAAVYERCL